jgi:hypothetical protein
MNECSKFSLQLVAATDSRVLLDQSSSGFERSLAGFEPSGKMTRMATVVFGGAAQAASLYSQGRAKKQTPIGTVADEIIA